LDTSFGEFCSARQTAGFDAPVLQAVTRRAGLFLECIAGSYAERWWRTCSSSPLSFQVFGYCFSFNEVLRFGAGTAF